MLLPSALALVVAGVVWWMGGRGPPPPLPQNLSSLDRELAKLLSDLAEDVSRNGGDTEVRMLLAKVYEANRLHSLAGETYAQVLDQDRSNGVAWFRYAICLEREGDLEQAISAMDESISLEPGYAAARWRQANWLLNIGDLERADRRIDETLRLEPDNESALLIRAKWLTVHGDNQEALGLIRERQLEQGENAEYARYLIGTAYRQLGELKQAESYLANVQNVRPVWHDDWTRELAQYQVGLARLRSSSSSHVRQKQWGLAIPMLETLLEQEPTDGTSWNLLGACYLNTRKVEQAASAFRRALSLNERHVGSNLNLSMALLVLSRTQTVDLDEALRLALRACELSPSSGSAREGYGRILSAMHRKSEARAALLEAYRLDTKRRSSVIEAGLICVEMNDWVAAASCFDQLTSGSSPREADLIIGLAYLQLQAGDIPGAGRLLTEARQSSLVSQDTGQRLKQLALSIQVEAGGVPKAGGGE